MKFLLIFLLLMMIIFNMPIKQKIYFIIFILITLAAYLIIIPRFLFLKLSTFGILDSRDRSLLHGLIIFAAKTYKTQRSKFRRDH